MNNPKKKKLFVPLFIAFLMVFSIFGIVIGSFGNPASISEKIDYNGYTFTFDGVSWYTYRDKQRIETNFDPREIDKVYTGELLNKIFNHKKIYLTMSPKDKLAYEREIFRQILASLTGVPVANSCIIDEEGCENLPLKDCNDSILGEVLVIKLEVNEENTIQEDESCVAILGNSEHLIMVLI